MKMRRVLFLIVSVALGAFFILLLIHIGKTNLNVTAQMLKGVSLGALCRLVALDLMLTSLSTVKWRLIDDVLRQPSDTKPSIITSFMVSNVGFALGLILPVQLAMTAARTISTRTYGRKFKRGTGGTIYEQSFDIFVVAAMMGASSVTWLLHGDGWTWLICSVPLAVAAILALGSGVKLVQSLAIHIPDFLLRSESRWLPHRAYRRCVSFLSALSDIQHSGLLNAKLVRRLMLLSIGRFVITVCISVQTARAVGIQIPAWYFAASVPFASVANFLSVTPGGIGLNELTSAAVLSLFGTPLTVASQWAISNRILGTAACLGALICSFILYAMKEKSWFRS